MDEWLSTGKQQRPTLTNGLQEECPRLWSILEQPRKPKAEPIEVIDLESDEEEMPMREGRKPWQLMGAFDDMRD